MGKVDVIVTNHDMVLADLALGGGAVLPDPRDTITCSTKVTTCRTRPSAISLITRACAPPPTGWKPPRKTSPSCWPSTRCRATLASFIEQVPELAREIKTQQQFMFTACEQVADFKPGEDVEGRERPRHRFSRRGDCRTHARDGHRIEERLCPPD